MRGDNVLLQNCYSLGVKNSVIVKKSSPKNLSADCQSTVRRLSADSRPTGFLGSSSSQLPKIQPMPTKQDLGTS